jgi:hypothetical protein
LGTIHIDGESTLTIKSTASQAVGARFNFFAPNDDFFSLLGFTLQIHHQREPHERRDNASTSQFP